MKKIACILSLFLAVSISLQAQDSTKNKAKDSLEIYIGKYKFPEGSPVSEITIVVENGKLIVKSKMGDAELEKAEGIDQFSMPTYQGTASFFRNEAKKVSGIHLDVMGRSLDGDKEEPAATPAPKEEKK
jgi:hypothetical protein